MNTGTEELRERMEHATAGIAVPSGLARRAAQHRRRRIVTRTAAAAGTAVVAAGVAIAATTAAAPRTGGTIAGARLVSDIRSALAATAAGDDVVQVRALNGSAEMWYHGGAGERVTRTESFSAPGQPSVDEGSTVTPATFTHTTVSYESKTWSRSVAKVDLMRRQPSTQTSCASTIGPAVTMQADPQTVAAYIREALSCGQLTSEGNVDVDGVSAIKLVSVLSRPQVGGARLVRKFTLLVNPATYLPVRWLMSVTVTQPGGQTSRTAFSYNVSWLPPTRANLASLQVPIPAGFTRVAPRAQP
jgi:hypothetical protein